MRISHWVSAFAMAVSGVLWGSASADNVTLRASHQFPGGKGDVRDEMVQIIAQGSESGECRLEVQVYPGASLFKPNEQWNANRERSARHLTVPARLRERQGARVQRDANAGPRSQS